MKRRETKVVFNTDELRQLIMDNPTLPIAVLAGQDANIDYGGWMFCSSVSVYKGEILDCEQEVNDERIYTDRDEFEEVLADWLAGSDEYAKLTDAEFDLIVKDKMKEYEPYWKECILIYVDN